MNGAWKFIPVTKTPNFFLLGRIRSMDQTMS